MDDVGEMKDGLVVFGEDTEAKKGLVNVGKMKVNKVYHSSSEDEEVKESKIKVVKLKKETKVAEDKKSAEFKEKMTKSFLQTNKKQKEAEELEAQKVAANEKAKARKKAVNKYYSDDECEAETKAAAADDESEGENKAGTKVLEQLETFAGDVWRDSDEEQENPDGAVKYNPMSIFQAKLREGGDEVVAAEDGTGVVTSSDEDKSDEEDLLKSRMRKSKSKISKMTKSSKMFKMTKSNMSKKMSRMIITKMTKMTKMTKRRRWRSRWRRRRKRKKKVRLQKWRTSLSSVQAQWCGYDPLSEEQDKFLRTDTEDTAGPGV